MAGIEAVRRTRARAGRSMVRPMAATGLVAAAALLAACQPPAAGPSIQVANVYIAKPVGGSTDAYLDISNTGSADRLTGARISVGGRVWLRGPAEPGITVMRTVPDIAIPGGTVVRLIPDGFHLLITGTRALHTGTQLTLTLLFARAGAVSVPTQVINPASHGGSYLTG